MSASHIILDNFPSLCQKLSDLVEVWCSYNKNNFAYFFETRCRLIHPCDRQTAIAYSELSIYAICCRALKTWTTTQQNCLILTKPEANKSIAELTSIYTIPLGNRSGLSQSSLCSQTHLTDNKTHNDGTLASQHRRTKSSISQCSLGKVQSWRKQLKCSHVQH